MRNVPVFECFVRTITFGPWNIFFVFLRVKYMMKWLTANANKAILNYALFQRQKLGEKIFQKALPKYNLIYDSNCNER